MDVPDSMLNVSFVLVFGSRGTGQATRMLMPGLIMSGFTIPGVTVLGPLEEKEATIGANESPITVPLNEIVAVGVVVEFM